MPPSSRATMATAATAPAASLVLPKPAYGCIKVVDGREVVVWGRRFRCDGCNKERSRPGSCCQCKIKRRNEGPPRICPDCGQVNKQVRAELCKLCKALRRPGSKEARAKANREAWERRQAEEGAEATRAAEVARVAEEAQRQAPPPAAPPDTVRSAWMAALSGPLVDSRTVSAQVTELWATR